MNNDWEIDTALIPQFVHLTMELSKDLERFGYAYAALYTHSPKEIEVFTALNQEISKIKELEPFKRGYDRYVKEITEGTDGEAREICEAGSFKHEWGKEKYWILQKPE